MVDQKEDENKKKKGRAKKNIINEAEVKKNLQQNRDMAKAFDLDAPVQITSKKVQGDSSSKTKMMSQALEQIIIDDNATSNMVSFSRGPEVEILTTQEMEMIRNTLVHMKVHIPADHLRRAIVMPRDQDSYHPELPSIMDSLLTNPYTDTGADKKKKRRGADVARGGLMRVGTK